jgi:acyl carrier protein
MALSRDDIQKKISEVLEEALGVDQDEITQEATLIGDLGAESIDFLDISFQLEKTFEPDCSPDRPFKIEQGELFPEREDAACGLLGIRSRSQCQQDLRALHRQDSGGFLRAQAFCLCCLIGVNRRALDVD